MLNGHGNDQYAYRKKIIADFSTNISKGKVSEKLKTILKTKLDTLHNYPDPEASIFLDAIAKHHKTSPQNALAFNGSTEAFYLIAHTFKNQQSFVRIPSFSEYTDACKLFDHTIEQGAVLTNEALQKNSLVWIGNPNNPNGQTLTKSDIKTLCKNHPNTLFIIDEAYADLCQDFESAIPLTSKYANLIVIRSLTKSFSVPGLRIGYLISDKKNIRQIKENMMPWNMNTLAIEAGTYIMKNFDELRPNTKAIIEQTKFFQRELCKLPELAITPSSCNFFLLKLNTGTALELKDYLIEKHGILIRDASNFNGLTDRHFRLSVQSEANNRLLISAIKEWFKSKEQKTT